MKLPTLTINFKMKVLLFVVVMLFIPLFVICLYFYGSLRTEILNDTNEEVRFEERLFSYMVSNSQMYAIREISYDLKIKEDILKSLSIMLSNVIDKTLRFNNQTLYDQVRDCILKSVNDQKTHFIIYDRLNRKRNVYLNQDDYKYLAAINRAKTKTLAEYIQTATLSEGSFMHFYYTYEGRPCLVGIYSMPNSSQLIVAIEDLYDYHKKYEESSDSDILKNVDIFLSALEYLDNNVVFSILNDQGKQLLSNQPDQFMPYPESILNEAKQDEFWVGGIMNKNQMTIASISYFPSLNWFITVTKQPNSELSLLIQNLVKVLFLTLWIALCGLLSIALILRKPFSRLKDIAQSAREIENVGLNDATKLAQISTKMPAQSCGYPDIDHLVLAFKNMSASLSDNVQNIIELSDKQKRVEGELNAAHNIQIGILPDDLAAESFAPYALSPRLISVKEVGGNFYDAIELDEQRFAVVIGGVSTTGVPAALFMTMTVTLIRQGMMMHLKPAALMTEINKILCLHNPNMLNVKLFICIINKSDHTITYANGGQSKPLLCSAKGIRSLTLNSGPAPGSMPDRQYLEFTDQLAEDEMLLLYTAGLKKAVNANGKSFGEKRIVEFIKNNYTCTAQQAASGLEQALKKYRDSTPLSDEITFMVVKQNG
ncbi:MAG: SpoIIE family protein phosphatase [Succinivibrio sp.]|nr:SpoIIE family protein phosphatase [Succinivibrio sp.]